MLLTIPINPNLKLVSIILFEHISKWELKSNEQGLLLNKELKIFY